MRRHAPLLLLALLPLLTGCASTYTAVITAPSGEATQLLIEGDSPSVELHNTGPGAVWVDVAVPAHATAEGASLVPGSALSRSTSAGPIRVLLTPEGTENATIKVEARRATGLSIEKPTTRK